MSPSRDPHYGALCGTGRLDLCTSHANGRRVTGSNIVPATFDRWHCASLAALGAPNHPFASYSILDTTWKMCGLHTKTKCSPSFSDHQGNGAAVPSG